MVSSDMTSESRRRVAAQCSVSLDGYSSGPGGPQHDQWLYATAMDPTTSAHTESIYRGADTAVLGRANFVGFSSVWPGITRDPATDARTRDLGQWLASVEKYVASRTLSQEDADAIEWTNVTVTSELEQTVRDLRQREGRDILILNSASVIQELLRRDLVDDLHLTVIPVILGGGLRLLPDDVSTEWDFAANTTHGHGALSTHYRRRR